MNSVIRLANARSGSFFKTNYHTFLYAIAALFLVFITLAIPVSAEPALPVASPAIDIQTSTNGQDGNVSCGNRCEGKK